jgi:hypothetical protein
VNDDARIAYLKDVADNPDGAWPIWRSGEPTKAAKHPLRRWFDQADLRGWMPRAPLTMCGGSSDPAVPFHLGAQLMMHYWSRPATKAPHGIVNLLNFDDPAMPKDQFNTLRLKMEDYRAQFIAGKGKAAMVDSYHTVIAPRFCYLAAREWFDTMR